MWRKKMDASMFDHKSTFIPHWVRDIFDIKETFHRSSTKDPRSEAEIEYRHPDGRVTIHRGWVTTTKYEKGRNDVMRLFVDEGVIENLQTDFKMTYLRTIEKEFRGWNSPTAESEIPFWEFLDIEYNAKDCSFIFVPHYTQEMIGLDRFTHLH